VLRWLFASGSGNNGHTGGDSDLFPPLPYFPLYYAVIVFGFTCIAIWASDGAEIFLQSKDCRHIVIDEMVGFMVAMFMVPPTLGNIVLGFVLFRALDIIKPFPIRSFEERVRGGYGVVLDDIIAGIYANLIIHVLRFTMLKGG
jgi:phosphatidylglycerophosphatase A